MRLRIVAIGRLRRGAEADLIADYIDRFNKTGRNMGLGPIEIIELEDKKQSGKSAEAELIRRALPKGGQVWAMDERGKSLSSPEFAKTIAGLRDRGCGDFSLIIGGADGICPGLVAECDGVLSFGKMVWPHMLARVMLTEQLYRAATILAGSPYHRV